MLTEAGRFLRRIALPLMVTALGVIGLGQLVIHPLDGVWPVSVEDDLVRTFADHRTDLWDDVSGVLSAASGVFAVAGVTLAASAVAYAVYRSWRAPLFLIGAVVAQTVVFGLTRLFVDRDRPTVDRL
ncbi:MAG TPA: hypothetical protein VLH10_17835, partial [Yinghuangia sp.]|nr:hypothetical protein [Yinghuangia sp.]